MNIAMPLEPVRAKDGSVGYRAVPAPVETLLAERAKTHGDFAVHASVTQALKHDMRLLAGETKWYMLDNEAREALEMIRHKIGRILAGDATFKDHWDDIAGYATLVAKRLS